MVCTRTFKKLLKSPVRFFCMLELEKGGMKPVRVKQFREFAPVVTGILLIALGLILPLGPSDSPRLIDLFSSWASSVIGLRF